jgi:uncharacterized protein YndB with AHSA1/START domain
MDRLVASVAFACACTLVPFRSADAEVVAAEASGFIVRSTATIAAPPATVYARFLEIGRWWNDEHTWSGKAANMSIEAMPGGCWCETLAAGGFVEHGRLTYMDPGRFLRFRAGLGPLHDAAAYGNITIAFEATGQRGTTVTLKYAVVMFEPQKGAPALAPLVDQVLGEQLTLLKKSVETAS